MQNLDDFTEILFQPLVLNNFNLSVELNWAFETKDVNFNKYSIIYKTNDSNDELYFIPKGKYKISNRLST